MSNDAPIPTWLFKLRDDARGVPRQLADGVHARVFAGERAMLSVVRIEPHSAGPIHSHPEEQWGIILEGECVRLQGDEAVPVKVGDFWHTPGGTKHGIRTNGAGALVLDVFSPPREEYQRRGEGVGE